MSVITLTPQAAKQIRVSTKQTQAEGMALRFAASKNADGSIHYGMGFEDIPGQEDDVKFTSEGIDIVIAKSSIALLEGTTVDYVELGSHEFNFIFLNPNDPNYTPPNK